MNGFSLLSTNWLYFNNSCANFYYNRTDTIVEIYISTKFIAFLYRTETKVEIMFKFTSKFSDDFKAEASSILNPVLPDDYSYSFFITEFKVLKQSVIVGETQFTLECRVNVEAKDDIDKLLLDIGRKSGTTYNKLRGDRQGKGTKFIANVVPVYKKDSKQLMENYRPISLLPVFGKIFEKILFNNL